MADTPNPDESNVKGYLLAHSHAEISEMRMRQCDFLLEFQRCMVAAQACATIGIPVATLYRWNHDDFWFRGAYKDARAWVNGQIHAVVLKRAIEGWEEPLYQSGKRVMEEDPETKEMKPVSVKKYDPRLLERVFISIEPQLQAVEDEMSTGGIGGNLPPGYIAISPDEQARLQSGALPEGWIAVPPEQAKHLAPILRQLEERTRKAEPDGV